MRWWTYSPSMLSQPRQSSVQTIDPGSRCVLTTPVRALRTARGLSQAELAAAMAVSRQTINAIETERYTPSLALALALVRYFESTVEEVFHADGSA
jgi:putative transcriptional regulator